MGNILKTPEEKLLIAIKKRSSERRIQSIIDDTEDIQMLFLHQLPAHRTEN